MTYDHPFTYLTDITALENERARVNRALDRRAVEIKVGREAAKMEPNVDFPYEEHCHRIGWPCLDAGTLEHDLRILAALCGDSIEGPAYTRPVLVGLIRGLAKKYLS